MPDIIQFKNGNQIRNLYDANGTKLKSSFYTLSYELNVPINTVADIPNPDNNYNVFLDGYDYCGNYEYYFSSDEGDHQFGLDKIHNTEGYALTTVPTRYCYYRKDHLGNNREVWENTGQITQRTQYYPSGLPWAYNTGDQPSTQPYKYNGKEFVETHGYDTYDYGARGYYPAIGRFTTVDPLAEKYYSISPYAYCAGNPVNRIDPNGMDVWEVNEKGEIVNRIRDKKQDAFYMVDKDGNRTYTTDKEGNKTYNSISFEYGTVKQAYSLTAGNDAYQVIGNENGTKMFEFLADNTKVEWNNTQFFSDKSIITTSHKKDEISGVLRDVFKLYSTEQVMIDVHSHPEGTPYPSGLKDRDLDIGAANTLEMLNPVMKSYIYLPGINKGVREAYIPYNSKSDVFDFRGHPANRYIPYNITITVKKQ